MEAVRDGDELAISQEVLVTDQGTGKLSSRVLDTVGAGYAFTFVHLQDRSTTGTYKSSLSNTDSLFFVSWICKKFAGCGSGSRC